MLAKIINWTCIISAIITIILIIISLMFNTEKLLPILGICEAIWIITLCGFVFNVLRK